MKDSIKVAISRTQNNCWKFGVNCGVDKIDLNNPVPAENVGDAIEDIAYYIENELGCECLFYYE